MKARTAFHWTFAFLCAALCLLSARAFIGEQGFTAVLHYDASGAPGFEQVSELIPNMRDEKPKEIRSAAAWAQGGTGTVSSDFTHTATVDLFFMQGDALQVFPFTMISGHMPANQGDGVALDEKTADTLFGSVQILGSALKIDGVPYTVCGVFALPKGLLSWAAAPERGVVVSSPPPDLKVQALGLLLTPSAQETVSRVAALTNSLGSPAYVEDRDLAEFLVNQTGRLPLWVYAVLAILVLFRGAWAYARRKEVLDPYTATAWQKVSGAAKRVLIILTCAAAAYGMLRLTDFAPRLPLTWLPTRWSDFDHWGDLVQRLGQDLAMMRSLPLLRPDLPGMTALGGMIVFGVMALLARPRFSQKISPVTVITAAFIPIPVLGAAYLLGFQMEFIPALVLLPVLTSGFAYAGQHLSQRAANMKEAFPCENG